MGFFSKKKDENKGFVINADDEAIKISGDKNLAPHAMTPSEVSSLWVIGDDEEATNTNALNSLKKRMHLSVDEQQKSTESSVKKPKTILPEQKDKVIINHKSNQTEQKTLIEKVKRYTIDEHGHDAAKTQEPLYQLESVAEILKLDSEDALKELSKKYDIQFERPSKSKNINTREEKPAKSKKPAQTAAPTPAFEQMVSDAEARESKELYEALFPSDKKSEIPDISVPDISDIDTHEVGISTEAPSNTATIRFTPVANTKGQTDHITISSATKHIDLDDSVIEEITSHSITKLEETDFEDFAPKNEYKDTASGKKILRKLAIAKRTHFLSSFASSLVLVALLIMLPFLSNSLLSNPKTTMLVATVLLSASVLANLNMFFEFKNLLKKCCSFDIMAALCSTFTIAFGITSALTKKDGYYIVLLCAFIVFVRSICKFKYVSAEYNSLKLITNEKAKNAVALINDPATTFAMAKNSIEGDILVAGHKKTNFIEDFMKHFEFHKTISGKVSIAFFVAVGLAAISGLISYFYYENIFDAVYAACAITCGAAIPTIFLIDALPFASASKKLNRKQSMIAGIYGAQRIENANAAVIRVDDIFPEGTVVMHNMKVLSNNNIDQTLLRAASLTAAVGSPLEAIFKEIAGSNDSYSVPDSDTIKYEKNLGISGWVDNEPLFIGNRSLMKAHGIDIPSLEVDKKILRKGFFPVYVATANAACALIVIQYNVDPEVARELHKITDLGVLLLVENCDPNVTEDMICDYFGLYENSIKVMSNAGVHMYKNATPDIISCSAAASYRGSGLNFIKIINRASGIKSANRILTVMYAVFAILGILCFVYAAFSGITGASDLPSQATVLIYTLCTFVLSIIGFLIRKP